MSNEEDIQELFDAVLNNPDVSYKLAVQYLKQKKDVPDKLIQSVSNSLFDSSWLCRNWITYKKENPPDVLVKTVLDSEKYTNVFNLILAHMDEYSLPDAGRGNYNSIHKREISVYPKKEIILKAIELLNRLLEAVCHLETENKNSPCQTTLHKNKKDK